MLLLKCFAGFSIRLYQVLLVICKSHGSQYLQCPICGKTDWYIYFHHIQSCCIYLIFICVLVFVIFLTFPCEWNSITKHFLVKLSLTLLASFNTFSPIYLLKWRSRSFSRYQCWKKTGIYVIYYNLNYDMIYYNAKVIKI